MGNYKIVEIPGQSALKIAVIDHSQDGPDSGTKSPEWMARIDISAGALTSSYTKGMETYTELIGWHGEASRESGSNMSATQMSTSASLRHSELVVIIPSAGYTATLESALNAGKPLDLVSIVRLGHVSQSLVMLQKIDFTGCRLHKIQQQLDELILRMKVATKMITVYVYDQDGNLKGQVESHTSYKENITID